jgi:protein-disulfide isomerase
MSSRVQEKAAAREARLQAEAAEAQRATRLRRIRILAGVAAVALVVVVVAVVAGSGSNPPVKNTGRDVSAMFDGIRQDGLVLGKATAPATLEEFVDPQCPYCREFSLSALPTVVDRYVRAGKLRIVMRPIEVIGPDSVTANRAVAAAGQQKHAFGFLEAFYANQQAENSGYVTDAFLRRVGNTVGGLDSTKMLRTAATDPAVTRALGAARSRAARLGISSTPTLMLTVGKGKPQELTLDATDYAGSITRLLDQALGA